MLCSVVPKKGRSKKHQGSESSRLLSTLYNQGLRPQDLDADSRHFLESSPEAVKVKVQICCSASGSARYCSAHNLVLKEMAAPTGSITSPRLPSAWNNPQPVSISDNCTKQCVNRSVTSQDSTKSHCTSRLLVHVLSQCHSLAQHHGNRGTDC